MTTNLPMIIDHVGGALASVASEMDKYTCVEFPMSRGKLLALGNLVKQHEELNNEHDVAALVDIFAFHGVDSAALLGDILKEYDISVVHLALNYLYEVGRRGRGEQQTSLRQGEDESLEEFKARVAQDKYELWFGDTGIASVCQLVADLEEAGRKVVSFERLDAIVHELGGLEMAVTFRVNDLAELLG